MDKRLPRFTFEEILKSQEALAQKIHQLIDENRALKDDEVFDFLRTYRRATGGMGARASPAPSVPGLAETTMDNLVINYLADPQLKKIQIGWMDGDERKSISPKEAWRFVLRRLNADVFGTALEHALWSSPEKVVHERQAGDRI